MQGCVRPTNPDPITVIKIYRGTPWCGYLRVYGGGHFSPKVKGSDEKRASNPRNLRNFAEDLTLVLSYIR